MEADTLHELTAAYALDALDERDEREYEEHLARCPRCREELVSLSEAATGLAYSVEAPSPPPGLRDRIIEQARAERPNVVPLVRRRWLVPALGTAAAVAAVVALGLGIWSISLSRSLDDKTSALEATEQALKIVGDANAARQSLTGADGSLVVARTGGGALVLCGLKPAPKGKTYEAWVIAGKTAARAGVFGGGRTCVAVPLTAPVPRDAVVGVTVERKGGADAPTQAPFITSRRV
jgi:anti-sigma factor RsiW